MSEATHGGPCACKRCGARADRGDAFTRVRAANYCIPCTERRTLVFGLGVAGIVGASAMLLVSAYGFPLHGSKHVLTIWLWLLALSPVATAIHESGHAVAALLCGGTVHSIQLGRAGPIVFRCRLGRTSLTAHAVPIGGMTRFSFHPSAVSRAKIFGVALGGVAANATAAGIGGVALYSAGASEGWIAFVVTNGFGLLNLLAFGPLGVPWSQSDGAMAVRVWGWPDDFLQDFRVSAETHRADRALRSADYATALQWSDAALARCPTAVAARLLRSTTCVALERDADALRSIRRLRSSRYPARVRVRALMSATAVLVAKQDHGALVLADMMTATAMRRLSAFPETHACRVLANFFAGRVSEAEHLMGSARLRWPALPAPLAIAARVVGGQHIDIPAAPDFNPLALAVERRRRLLGLQRTACVR